MITTPNGNTYATYQDYLRSEDWSKKRKEALKYYGYKCRLCGNGKNLQVHHIHYDSVGSEGVLDLTPLCDGCHFRYHDRPRKKHKKPKKKRKNSRGKKKREWFQKFKTAPPKSRSDELKDRIKEIKRVLESIEKEALTANEYQLISLQETKELLNEELEQKISEYIKL